jgi:hypothetical protein
MQTSAVLPRDDICILFHLLFILCVQVSRLTEGFTGAGYAAGHRQLGPEASLALYTENLSTNQETTTFIQVYS